MSCDIEQKLCNGYLLFYGYSYRKIPEEIRTNFKSRINFYFKTSGQTNKIKEDVEIKSYSGYQDTGWETSDIVFFDQDSVKSLLIGYPSNAKYVFVNFMNIRYIHWIFLGLLRRLLIKQVRFIGFRTLSCGSKKSHWIVLARDQVKSNNNFYLSRKIGIEGFLNFLKCNHVNYVIPRHFESLPNLHREGGDLDLIVSDDDEKKVKNFLLDNEGDIRVDVWSVSGPNYHGITYMPPHIAQNVIDNSIEGKCSSNIPNKLDTLNCMIFHVLYHKGFQSGIPSKHKLKPTNKNITNDYLGLIRKYANELNIKISLTMESLDSYMASEGWRPANDTLAKIAQWNEWVRINFFSEIVKPKSNLFALILKAEAVELNMEQKVIYELENDDYVLLAKSHLKDKIQQDAINKIRGGVWNDGLINNKNIEKYHPSMILLLLDKNDRGELGMKKFKERIRKKLDTSKTSYIHTTDNNQETWDYINICLPHRENELRNKINTLKINSTKTQRNTLDIQYKILNLKTKIKSILIDILSH